MGLFNFFKKKSKPTPSKQTEPISPPNESPNKVTEDKPQIDESQIDFIKDVSSNAERIQSAYNEHLGNALDFSVASLAALDQLLEQFHENVDVMEEEMYEDLIAQAGSYIFEVARRNFGGKYFWVDSLNQPILVTGMPEFEISITAMDKVRMRLQNGSEDNIPFYFEGYVERVSRAKPGDKALIN